MPSAWWGRRVEEMLLKNYYVLGTMLHPYMYML